MPGRVAIRTYNLVLGVLLPALFVLGNCGRRRDTWLAEYRTPLSKQTAGVEGRPCDEGEEHDACDPFVCHRGACLVKECSAERECPRGSCIEGYCALPPPQPGRKCEPYDPDAANSVLYPAKMEPPKVHDARVAKYLERFDRCACRPEYWTEGVMYASSRECGPFPCTPNGCHVQPCESDSDCAAGLCSSHASGPNGWCVTSDPY